MLNRYSTEFLVYFQDWQKSIFKKSHLFSRDNMSSLLIYLQIDNKVITSHRVGSLNITKKLMVTTGR